MKKVKKNINLNLKLFLKLYQFKSQIDKCINLNPQLCFI